jgi:hypothetical protein
VSDIWTPDTLFIRTVVILHLNLVLLPPIYFCLRWIWNNLHDLQENNRLVVSNSPFSCYWSSRYANMLSEAQLWIKTMIRFCVNVFYSIKLAFGFTCTVWCTSLIFHFDIDNVISLEFVSINEIRLDESVVHCDFSNKQKKQTKTYSNKCTW